MDVQVRGKVGLLRRVVEELREKTWELDTNKRNNLVLYGVREEASPGNTEWAVREVSNTAGNERPRSFSTGAFNLVESTS